MVEKSGQGHRQRIKERFIAGEEDARSDKAILELLLTYAIPQKDVQPFAETLLAKFGTLSAVLDASPESLYGFTGIKSHSIVLLKVVDWIRLHCSPIGAKQEGTEEPLSQQLGLFDRFRPPEAGTTSPTGERTAPRKQVIPRRGTELFSKALLEEAIRILPELPETDSLNEMRSYLKKNLPFNAEQTRHRYANYITRRMFAKGYADYAVRKFAKMFPDSQALRDACYYRFLNAEPLQSQIAEDLLLPNLGAGSLNRERIRSYLADRYPTSRSIKDCTQAIVDALNAGGVAKVDKTRVRFGYRDIPLEAFAFLLHSEFPDPGMYDISRVQDNRFIHVMLWNPARILPSLYELRNRGLISKVSEIDAVRQFTTIWTLEQIVDRLSPGD